jgi:hypothetical protein
MPSGSNLTYQFRRVLGLNGSRRFIVSSIRAGHWWGPIRDDPGFDELLELLESKVTHTEQYLRDQNIEQKKQ